MSTTDAQRIDELATELEELLNSPESGRVIDSELFDFCSKRFNAVMLAPAPAEMPTIFHVTEIDNAIKTIVPGTAWDPVVRQQLFSNQLETIEMIKKTGNADGKRVRELASFLRMFIVGIETYRSKLLNR